MEPKPNSPLPWKPFHCALLVRWSKAHGSLILITRHQQTQLLGKSLTGGETACSILSHSGGNIISRVTSDDDRSSRSPNPFPLSNHTFWTSLMDMYPDSKYSSPSSFWVSWWLNTYMGFPSNFICFHYLSQSTFLPYSNKKMLSPVWTESPSVLHYTPYMTLCPGPGSLPNLHSSLLKLSQHLPQSHP